MTAPTTVSHPPASNSQTMVLSTTFSNTTTPMTMPQTLLHHPLALALTDSCNTAPHHNKSFAKCKNKIFFSLQVMLSALQTGQKATTSLKLDAYIRA